MIATNQPPRVLHVINWVGTEYGGPVTGLGRYIPECAGRHGTTRVLARNKGAELSAMDALNERGVAVLGAAARGPERLFLAARSQYEDDCLAWAQIIHVHGLHGQLHGRAAAFARESGTPLVVRPCGAASPLEMKKRPRLKRLYEEVVMRSSMLREASVIHCTSEQEVTDVERLGLAAPKVIARPRAVMHRAAAPSECRAADHRHVVAYTGRLHPRKNLELVAGAISYLRGVGVDIELHVAGRGDPAIEARLIDRLGPFVQVKGHLSGQDKWRHISGACCSILVSDHENWGMAVQESWEGGRPVLVSPGVALASSIQRDDTLGRVVEPSVREVAEGLRDLLDRGASEGGRRPFEACARWVDAVGRKADEELDFLYALAMSRSPSHDPASPKFDQ